MKQTSGYSVHFPVAVQVEIEEETLNRVKYFVAHAPVECQWYHRLTKTTTKEGIIYKLTGLYIPEQWVQAAEVEADPSMLTNYWMAYRKEHGFSLKELSEVLTETTCWAHSHVRMACNPSGQDNKQFRQDIKLGLEGGNLNPRMMLIMNKHDDVFIKIFDPDVGLVFENPKLVVLGNTMEDLDKIIAERLKPKPKPKPKVRTWSGSPGSTGRPSSPPMDRRLIDWNSNWDNSSGSSDSEGQGKAQGDATKKMEMEELFSDRYAVSEMLKLIDFINCEIHCSVAVKTLVGHIDNSIHDNEYELLLLLLWGELTEIMLYFNTPPADQDLNMAKAIFADTLEGDTIDPEERLFEALDLIKVLREPLTPDEANKRLTTWAKEMV